jgi:hypothetical protein
MSIFFQDPHEVRLPPEEVRLKEVQVIPVSQDGRAKILVELTPFQQRPNVEVSITDPSGRETAHATILESMLAKLEFTMHIRKFDPELEYQAITRVYYQRLPEASKEPVEIELPEPLIVDQNVTKFVFLKRAP